MSSQAASSCRSIWQVHNRAMLESGTAISVSEERRVQQLRRNARTHRPAKQHFCCFILRLLRPSILRICGVGLQTMIWMGITTNSFPRVEELWSNQLEARGWSAPRSSTIRCINTTWWKRRTSSSVCSNRKLRTGKELVGPPKHLHHGRLTWHSRTLHSRIARQTTQTVGWHGTNALLLAQICTSTDLDSGHSSTMLELAWV